MYQTKDGDRSGLPLLGEISLSCESSVVRKFFFLRILPNIQRRARNCAELSQRSRRVSSVPVERSPGRSCLNWDVLGCAGSLSLPGRLKFSTEVFSVPWLYFHKCFLRLGIAYSITNIPSYTWIVKGFVK